MLESLEQNDHLFYTMESKEGGGQGETMKCFLCWAEDLAEPYSKCFWEPLNALKQFLEL